MTTKPHFISIRKYVKNSGLLCVVLASVTALNTRVPEFESRKNLQFFGLLFPRKSVSIASLDVSHSYKNVIGVGGE